jgi:hypothetical protein
MIIIEEHQYSKIEGKCIAPIFQNSLLPPDNLSSIWVSGSYSLSPGKRNYSNYSWRDAREAGKA